MSDGAVQAVARGADVRWVWTPGFFDIFFVKAGRNESLARSCAAVFLPCAGSWPRTQETAVSQFHWSFPANKQVAIRMRRDPPRPSSAGPCPCPSLLPVH